jgi:hypothetical protein
MLSIAVSAARYEFVAFRRLEPDEEDNCKHQEITIAQDQADKPRGIEGGFNLQVQRLI